MESPPTVVSGWNPGQTGIGLNFDGIDNYVDCGVAHNFGITDKFTMSTYVRYGADPATFNGMILSKLNFDFYSRSISTEIRFETITLVGTEIASIPFSSFDSSKWNLLTGVYDGSVANVYLNGVYVDGDVQSGDIVDTSAHSLEIGKKPASTLYFNGSIDQPRIQNRVWTAKEVKDYAINPWQVYLDE